MSIVDKHGEFVKKQVSFHEAQAQRFANNSYRHDMHQGTAAQFRSLLADMENLDAECEREKSLLAQRDGQPKIPTLAEIALKPDELSGLPQDVISELSVSGADPTDFHILEVINNAGGVLSLDRIIIGLYRSHGEKVKRTTLTSRLNRMIPKGLLHAVPSRRGLYSTTPFASEEIGEPANNN